MMTYIWIVYVQANRWATQKHSNRSMDSMDSKVGAHFPLLLPPPPPFLLHIFIYIIAENCWRRGFGGSIWTPSNQTDRSTAQMAIFSTMGSPPNFITQRNEIIEFSGMITSFQKIQKDKSAGVVQQPSQKGQLIAPPKQYKRN